MKRIYVRFPNWVGDVVMATSLLSALRQCCPAATIEVALRAHLVPLLWGNPDLNELLPIGRPEEHSVPALMKWQGRLREKRFDAALILAPSFSSALPPALARIPMRAGWAENGRSFLLTHAVHRKQPFYEQPMIDQYAALLKSIVPEAPSSLPNPRLILTDSHLQLAKEAVARCGLGRLEKPLIILAASGARGPAKRWIPSRFAAVAEILHRQGGGSIVLAGGGPGDESDLMAVKGFAGQGVEGIFVGEQKNGLAELTGLISKADLVIGNDTGTLHMAGALGKPVVAVFGSTSPRWTPPLGPSTTILFEPAPCSPCYRPVCRFKRHFCMENVTVDMVVQAASRALQTSIRKMPA